MAWSVAMTIRSADGTSDGPVFSAPLPNSLLSCPIKLN